MQLYFIAAKLLRRVDDRLKVDEQVSTAKRNNIKYYVLLQLCRPLTGQKDASAVQLSEIDVTACTDECVDGIIADVSAVFERLGGNDRVAKGPELLAALNEC